MVRFGFTDVMVYFFVITWVFLLKFSSGGRVKGYILLQKQLFGFFAFSAYKSDEYVFIVENVENIEKHKETKKASNLTTC